MPESIHSDLGTQLTAVAGEAKEWEGFKEEAERRGIKWTFSPAACPWRNGQAERAIGLAKGHLKNAIEGYELLSFAALETVLLEVASLINKRPLTVRVYEDGEYFPVAQADLLLGRMSGYQGTREEGEEVPLGVQVARVDALVRQWWNRWQQAAFELFAPRKRWMKQHRNMEEGDIVLLKGEPKLGSPSYRLGKVVRVSPDEDGVVRTATVALRDRRRRGQQLAVREVPMAAQRLAVLLPLGEEWQGGLANPQ